MRMAPLKESAYRTRVRYRVVVSREHVKIGPLDASRRRRVGAPEREECLVDGCPGELDLVARSLKDGVRRADQRDGARRRT
jgi:hypothetical protein